MSGRLTVLNIAYPFAAVGPDAVGGAEQVVAVLDAGLVAAGHRSVVMACEGSCVAGTLLAIPRFGGAVIDGAVRAAAHAAIGAATAAALDRWTVDVVHLHGVDFHAYLPPPGPPALVTLHLPPAWYSAEALHPSRDDVWLHGVSAAQHAVLVKMAGAGALLGPIANGVAADAFAARWHARRGFALTLGRICPEKGQHLALEAAEMSEVPLLLAGEVFPYAAHRAYFEAKIVPRLGRGRRWIGPVGFVRKRRLLAAARCVLIPSLAAETSSLVAMEALASGTPVIAFPSGALAEIVEHGRTGFLVHDAREMAAAIRDVGTINPAVCLAAARERFAQGPMIAAYLRRYAQLAARRC